MAVLTRQRGLIFRITHIDNVAWILEHGLHCRTSAVRDPSFVQIGNAELIEKRASRLVKIPPGGALSEYVPFYFTPCTPMLLNIKTGYGGIQQRQMSEIVILVSSLPRLAELGSTFVFSDRHAYLVGANFYSSIEDLGNIDWGLLQRRNFKRDPDDPGKFEAYQAEALVHRHLPAAGLIEMVCHDANGKARLEAEAKRRALSLPVIVRPEWYF